MLLVAAPEAALGRMVDAWASALLEDFLDVSRTVAAAERLRGSGGPQLVPLIAWLTMLAWWDPKAARLAQEHGADKGVQRLGLVREAARGCEVRGHDDAGLEPWYREWFYKSDVRRVAVNVSLRREGTLLEDDPEIEAMLDSMVEVAPPK
jgi:hypothetical protein